MIFGPALEQIGYYSVWTRRLAIALALVVTHLAIGYGGWVAKSNAVDAAALEQVRQQQEANVLELLLRGRINAGLVAEKARADVAAESEFRGIREEVSRVFEPREDAGTATPAPGTPCESRGHRGGHLVDPAFVRVWNDALVASVRNTAAGAATAAAAAGVADAGSVTEERVLGNHVDNAEIDGDNRRQCELLLAWHARQGSGASEH